MTADHASPAVNKKRLTAAAWGCVVAALVLQYALFREHALREVVWAYPSAHDQTYYLTISYDTYEHMVNDGLVAGIRYGMTLEPPPPTGRLLHLQAALLFLFLGPGRLSALTVNFLYFALLQVVLFGTMRKLSGRWAIAFLAWGLLLTCTSPFFWAGGLMDFRIDFSAACMFGTLVCLALASGLFASRRWSIVVGLAGAYLVLLRFLMLVYLGGVILLFGVVLFVRLWRARDNGLWKLDRRRLLNLGIAILIAGAIAVPGLWRHRKMIASYYIEGHVTGKEAGIRVLMDGHAWGYYPQSLAMDHTGPAFIKLALLSLFAAGGLAWLAGTSSRPRAAGAWLFVVLGGATLAALLMVNDPRWSSRWLWWGLGLAAGTALAAALWRRRSQLGNPFLPGPLTLLFLLLLGGVPLTALTIDLHRSPVVGNVLVVPGVCLIVLPAVLWGRLGGAEWRSPHRFGWGAVAVVAVLSGSFGQLDHYAQRWKMTRHRGDTEQLLQMHDAIGRTVLANNIRRPVVALTAYTDQLAHRTSEVLLYEHFGAHRTFLLETGYFDHFTEEKAQAAFDKSDFIILARPEACVTPFERSMTELLPKLRTYCDEHFVCLGTYQVLGDAIRLYTRGARLQGGESGWVTSEGLTLSAPARALAKHSVELRGPYNCPLAEPPRVHAYLVSLGQRYPTLPATFERCGADYCIRVDCRGIDPHLIETAEVRLSFDHSFVPAELGNSTDKRHLVVPTPEKIDLVRCEAAQR
jgi:hypothetical protein